MRHYLEALITVAVLSEGRGKVFIRLVEVGLDLRQHRMGLVLRFRGILDW